MQNDRINSPNDCDWSWIIYFVKRNGFQFCKFVNKLHRSRLVKDTLTLFLAEIVDVQWLNLGLVEMFENVKIWNDSSVHIQTAQFNPSQINPTKYFLVWVVELLFRHVKDFVSYKLRRKFRSTELQTAPSVLTTNLNCSHSERIFSHKDLGRDDRNMID